MNSSDFYFQQIPDNDDEEIYANFFIVSKKFWNERQELNYDSFSEIESVIPSSFAENMEAVWEHYSESGEQARTELLNAGFEEKELFKNPLEEFFGE